MIYEMIRIDARFYDFDDTARGRISPFLYHYILSWIMKPWAF